jgi:DNA (cytosine-5)-methyltransferase 1
MLENVPGLLESKFEPYRNMILNRLLDMGYIGEWKLIQASDFGVPQLRPRAVLVAVLEELRGLFTWPEPLGNPAPTVGETLYDLMASNGWPEAKAWAKNANKIAPTLVGGSHKHGGPDLGPSRAKQYWQKLGVNGHRVGSETEIPDGEFKGVLLRDGTIREGYENMPLLTVRMAARIQGFPDYWQFSGKKTHAYRQVGNAFPPLVSEAIGKQIKKVVDQLGKDDAKRKSIA